MTALTEFLAAGGIGERQDGFHNRFEFIGIGPFGELGQWRAVSSFEIGPFFQVMPILGNGALDFA